MSSIQTAINAATDGDTVNVAPGTYYENINFNGKNITVSGADSSNTIIDGGQNGSVVIFENGEDTTAVLKNFTIQNGYSVDDLFHYYRGGGVYVHSMYQATSAKLENLLIKDNVAGKGGGVNLSSGEIIIDGCTISGNTGEGGGIQLNHGINAIIRNSVISNNTNGGGNGGGMVVFNTALDMDGCSILNNTSRNGAGVYIDIDESGKEAVIKNSFIENNVANDGQGGGLYNKANTYLFNSSISYNESIDDAGGGIYNWYVNEINIVECTIQGNTTNSVGGAIRAEGTLYISRSRVVDNYAGHKDGGIELCCGIQAEIYNTIFSDNSSGNGIGDALAVQGHGTVVSKNNIFWNNGAKEIVFEPFYESPIVFDIEYSIVKNGIDGIENQDYPFVWGPGMIDEDPQLTESYYIGENSPAIDSGNPHVWFNDEDGTRNDMGNFGGNGLNVSATNLDFGFTAIGNTKEKTINIHSHKDINDYNIASSSSDDLQFSLDTELPLSLNQHSKKEITFEFSPSASGTQDGVMILETSEEEVGTFNVSGYGIDFSDGIVLVPTEIPTIQEAIDAANDGDTILVASGTYYENIIINKNVKIIGEDWTTTILDGSTQGRSVVYFGQYAGDDALLSEFKIQNGIGQTGAHAASSGRCGGGIFIDANASPQLLKLHVTNNQAESKGAGIFKNTGGTLKISHSIIDFNFGTENSQCNGGGIGGDGGGEGSIIYDCVIRENHATYEGGGIYLPDNPIIVKTIIHKNTSILVQLLYMVLVLPCQIVL